MSHHPITRATALGLALAALSAPAAAAQAQDLRSPDTRDIAGSAQTPQDLRSPDARDAARVVQTPEDLRSPYAHYPVRVVQTPEDLRSPDARDAGEGRGTRDAPDVTVVTVPERLPAAGGIDWGDAGIGAGGALGVILLGAVTTVAVLHRRQGRPARRATAPSG